LRGKRLSYEVSAAVKGEVARNDTTVVDPDAAWESGR
jgi:hypothetical protein